jgi:hypothetical protein
MLSGRFEGTANASRGTVPRTSTAKLREQLHIFQATHTAALFIFLIFTHVKKKPQMSWG